MIEDIFKNCQSNEDRYKKIIELGRELPQMKEGLMIDENLVPGCQSIMYLDCELKGGKVFFSACSDALISKGLAALLIQFYNGMTPAEVVKEKPIFLEKLGLLETLSPSRSNGVASMVLSMQKKALKYLLPSF